MEFEGRARRAATGASIMPGEPVPGRRSLAEGLTARHPHVQQTPADRAAPPPAPLAPGDAPRPTLQMLFATRRGTPATSPSQVHAAAARGTATAATQLPHLAQIQRSFGRHDVAGVKAHVGGAAAASAREIGARAYATGDHVALGDSADLRTTAHEAAHVVQQRAGLTLSSGVGQHGDAHERHADEVAEAVVRGQSAEPLLDQYADRARPVGDPAAGPAIAPVQRMEDGVLMVVGFGVFLFLVRILGSLLHAYASGRNQAQRGTGPVPSPELDDAETHAIAQDLAGDPELLDKAQKARVTSGPPTDSPPTDSLPPDGRPSESPSRDTPSNDEETARKLAGDEQVARKVTAAIERGASPRRQQTEQEAFVAERRVTYFEQRFAQSRSTQPPPSSQVPTTRGAISSRADQPYPEKKPMGTMKDLLDRERSSRPDGSGRGAMMNRGSQTQTIVQSPEETTPRTSVRRLTGAHRDVEPTSPELPSPTIVSPPGEKPTTSSGAITTAEHVPLNGSSIHDPAAELESFAEAFLEYMRKLIADHIPMPEDGWNELRDLVKQARRLGLQDLARRLERLADKTPSPEDEGDAERPDLDSDSDSDDDDDDDGPSDPEALAIQNFMRTTGQIAMRGTLNAQEIAYWSTHPPGPQELHPTYHWMLSDPSHRDRLLARVAATRQHTSQPSPDHSDTGPKTEPPSPGSEPGTGGPSPSLAREQGLGACADLCKALKALNGAPIPPELEDRRRTLLAWARGEHLDDLVMTLERLARTSPDAPTNEAPPDSTSPDDIENAPRTSPPEIPSHEAEVSPPEALRQPEPKPTQQPEPQTEPTPELTTKPPIKTERELRREQAQRERQQREDNATAVYQTIAYVQEQLRQLQRMTPLAYDEIEHLLAQLQELTDNIYKDGLCTASIAKLKAYVMRRYTELHERLTGGSGATVFTGQNGVFTGPIDETTLTEWILAHSTYPMAHSNAAQCAREIIAHNGRTSGGGTRFTYDGHTVFHISHGVKDSNDGCTVFFIVTPDGVTIVGVGRHLGSSSYELDWKLDGWANTRSVQL